MSTPVASRSRGADRAIVAAVVDLVGEGVPRGDLTVALVIGRAGVSRTTFYSHFADCDAAFVAAVGRFLADAEAHAIALLDDPDRRAPDALRAEARRCVRLADARRGVVLAAVEEWPRIPELGALYLGCLDRIAVALAAALVADGPRGASAPRKARALASVALWSAERAVYGHLVGAQGLKSPVKVADTIVDAFLAVSQRADA